MTGSPVRVTFVNAHYAPDVAATGQVLTDLAEHLVRQGAEVEVLTTGGDYRSGRMKVKRREIRNGVRVRRLPATAFGRTSTAGRLIDYLTFFASAFFVLLVRRPRQEILVLLTTPPMLPVLGWLRRLVRGGRYIVWSMDLHPEAEEAVGMIRPDGLASRVLRGLMRRAYRGAERVVALGPIMAERLLGHGLESDRIVTIPVWGRAGEVWPVPRESNSLASVSDDRFVIMYSGNAGLAHRFEEALNGMALLGSEAHRVRYLFVGGGPRRESVLKRVEELGIEDFEYRDYYPRQKLAESLSLGDLHLVTLRHDMAGIAVPVKIFGVMAVGRPVLFVGPSRCETAMIVTDTGCGWVVDPERTDDAAGDIASIVRACMRDPSICERTGESGRTAFLERYESRHRLQEWSALLEKFRAPR